MTHPEKRVFILLQARLGSSRFPGKVLTKIAGYPMLLHCINRLQKIKNTQVIVVTSNSETDDPVEDFVKTHNVNYFRGDEEDVLDRYLQAAKALRADIIIRATADNPLVDPQANEKVIQALRSGKYDYAYTNTYPIGINAEGFTFDALYRSWTKAKHAHHREHVNEYILENQGLFNIKLIEDRFRAKYKNLQFTVDTPKQRDALESVILATGKPSLEVVIEDCLRDE